MNNELDENINNLNEALKTEYAKMIDSGMEQVYYIDSNNATGNDNEGTVDGVHFTDLGFIRYADFLIERFREFGLVAQE